jgi:hypothetical protein
MKSLRKPAWSGAALPRLGRTARLFCGVVLLAGGFWTALLPVVLGREMAAADMIAEQLPDRKTLKNATKMEFLGAVCAAVRRRRSAAAAITQAGVAARRESAGEIVGMVLRCSRKIDCETVGPIVAAATAAEGDTANIADAAMAKAPNCAETIREATRREAKVNDRVEPKSAPEQGPLIGTSNGPEEAFDPHEQLNLVCDEGTPRVVRTSQLDEFLRSNPGSFVGPCQTPPQMSR